MKGKQINMKNKKQISLRLLSMFLSILQQEQQQQQQKFFHFIFNYFKQSNFLTTIMEKK